MGHTHKNICRAVHFYSLPNMFFSKVLTLVTCCVHTCLPRFTFGMMEECTLHALINLLYQLNTLSLCWRDTRTPQGIVHDPSKAQSSIMPMLALNACPRMLFSVVHRWDTRTAQGIVQDSSKASYTGGKDYSRNTNFTCMATSGDGYVAVGSKVPHIVVAACCCC